MQTVRTRFAPSPTGYLHVGGVRTALFAWLLARQNNGKFVLRIEDTDKNREVAGAEAHIIKCLTELGLKFDEGPGKDGPYGPYRQSDRLEVYQKYANELIKAGRAYADPYSPAEVQAFREQAQAAKQPFLFRNHRPAKPPKWQKGMPLRFKSEPKAYKWHDAVMGNLSAGPEVVDDFILIKSDGYPTYNFAHIVDDWEMKISHVIRGQEFLASVPNYLNLYEALGFDMSSATKSPHERLRELQGEGQEVELTSTSQRRGKPRLPIWATMPHIMNETGNKKLSKRDGARDVLDYLRDGFLPEGLVNFIATLGWNDGSEQELFSIQELIDKFSLERVHKSGARFDERRLEWVNGAWNRILTLDDLYERSTGFWPESAAGADDNYKKQVLGLVQERLKYFAELPRLVNFFFEDLPPDTELLTKHKQLKKLSGQELLNLLSQAETTLKDSSFKVEDLTNRLNKLLEQTGQKPAVLFSLIRVATTWAQASPGLADTLAVLGKTKSLSRLKNSQTVIAEQL